MSDTLTRDATSVALAGAHSLINDLFAADLSGGADAEFLASYAELERLSRRLAAVEHRFIAEVEARSIPFEHAKATTGGFLRQFLRLHPGEASARVAAAAAAGPRRAVTGEALEPIYTRVAAAQATGEISARHAAVVVRAVEELPDAVQAERGVAVEAELVGFAADFDPAQLARLAQRVHAHLDPDGRLKDAQYRDRCRDLTVRARPDGSSSVAGELTAECTERLLGVFDALAAPRGDRDGEKDTRTAGQRRHDALLDALTALPATGSLPSTAGVATTVIVTMSEESYRAGHGTAETSHGALVPAAEAKTWGGADQRLFLVALAKTGEVIAHNSGERLFSERQRIAILTRDRGCTFPHCEAPPAWTQIHHITPWRLGGKTSLDNGAMICGFHHRTFEHLKWQCVMRDGRPEWIPPSHVDPAQRPQRNRLHDITLPGNEPGRGQPPTV